MSRKITKYQSIKLRNELLYGENKSLRQEIERMKQFHAKELAIARNESKLKVKEYDFKINELDKIKSEQYSLLSDIQEAHNNAMRKKARVNAIHQEKTTLFSRLAKLLNFEIDIDDGAIENDVRELGNELRLVKKKVSG